MVLIIINGLALIFLSILVLVEDKVERNAKIAGVVISLLVVFGADFFIINYQMKQMKQVATVARAKACASNIRVLTGAVEMYNMDHLEMMKKLDINKLINSSPSGFTYLKAEPSKPEPECKYVSEGDLSSVNGFIKCEKHGTLEDIQNNYVYKK